MPSSSLLTSTLLTPVQTITHLREGRHDDLDTHLNGLQQAYERGELSERDLDGAFDPFDSECWTLGEKLRAWTEAHPESYAAHQATSKWLLGQAWRLRGGTTSDLVSDRGSRGMQGFLRQSAAAAHHAMQFTARPLLSHLHLGRIQNTYGCDLALDDVEKGRWPDWFRHGLDLEPHSFLLRSTLLMLLRTEWGGSDKHMLAFLRGQEAELSSADRQKLWAQFNGQLAHHALHFEQDVEKALEYTRSAVSLDPSYHYTLAYVELFRGEMDAARAAYMTALRADLPDPHARLGSKAFYASTRLFGDSGEEARLILEMLRREADAGEREAFRLVAMHLLNNPGLTDTRSPREWLEQALVEGDNEGTELLIHLVRTTTRNDREVMKTTLFAADEGSPYAAAIVWQNYGPYAKLFDLDDRARYRYLLAAADGGDNAARLALASLLRRGRAELGEDGVLRPLRATATKESLEYAEHLTARAKHEGYRPIHGLARRISGWAWTDLRTPQARRRALLIVFLAWLVYRLIWTLVKNFG